MRNLYCAVNSENNKDGEGWSPASGKPIRLAGAAGINYADVLARSGLYPTIRKAPFVLGFEVAGVVRAAGKCVEGFKAGDSVAAITPAGSSATGYTDYPSFLRAS